MKMRLNSPWTEILAIPVKWPTYLLVFSPYPEPLLPLRGIEADSRPVVTRKRKTEDGGRKLGNMEMPAMNIIFFFFGGENSYV